MYKMVLFSAILIVVLVSLTVSAFVAMQVETISPSLPFSGTTANCEVSIRKNRRSVLTSRINFVKITIQIIHG